MADWLMKVIKSEAKQLIALAAADDDLRAELRALAEEILAATEKSQVEAKPAPLPLDPSGPMEPAETGCEITVENALEPLRALTLGRPATARGAPGVAPTSASPRKRRYDELAELEARCRWKGEAARWAIERLLRGREGSGHCEPDEPIPSHIAEWADKFRDCYYWATASKSSQQGDFSLLEDAAGCFESLAEGLASVRTAFERNQGVKVFERMLPLVAEAQSALRIALKRLSAPDAPEQLEVFEWVKATAARHRVYLKRFMRADDAADPSNWSNLLARVEAAATSGQLTRQQTSELERIKEHAKRIEAGEGSEQEWQAIIGIVEQLVADGIPPSNPEIRNVLLSVIDDLPERQDLPDAFGRVLREIDRYLARRPSPTKEAVTHAMTPEAVEARRLLHGRSVMLIGGVRRRETQESLRRALGLSELIWIETKEHQSIDSFEPLIARADVAVVLLAIRWSSHAFGDVRHFCDRHGKPLVRLPGGYSPNQVAAQLVAQCSEKLQEQAENYFPE
jgi:hypothetical protein